MTIILATGPIYSSRISGICIPWELVKNSNSQIPALLSNFEDGAQESTIF